MPEMPFANIVWCGNLAEKVRETKAMNEERFKELVEKHHELQQKGVRILKKIRKIEREIELAGLSHRLTGKILKGESK